MWAGGVRVVILDEYRRILMVKQRHEDRDIWMVPGGGIEEGENAREAAVREVLEETGLEVKVEKMLWHMEEVSDRGQRFVNFFLATKTGGELALGADPELGETEQVLREVRFLTQKEVLALEHVYPAFLRDELWHAIGRFIDVEAAQSSIHNLMLDRLMEKGNEYDPFKIREDSPKLK